MERYVNWYILQLKAWCKKKTCWLQILAMCLLLGILLSVSVPGTDNLNIGICKIQQGDAERIADILEQSDSIFTFEQYTEEAEMLSDIVSGKLECGFVFAEDFDERIQSKDIRHCIKYMETPFLTKGKVARETFFAAFLQIYGESILTGSMEEIYGTNDAKIAEKLLKKNQKYLDSEEVFLIQQKTVLTQSDMKEESHRTYPVHGLVAFVLFYIMFMEAGRKFEQEKRALLKAFEIRERSIFVYLGVLAAVTAAMLVGIVWIISTEESRGIWQEGIFMLLYVLYSALWVICVGQLFRNRTTFMAWATTLSLIQLILCPVFVDFSIYLRALRYVRCIFPMGIYLNI